MGRRRLSREIVLQALYLVDSSKVGPSEAFLIVTAKLEERDLKVLVFAQEILHGTAKERAALDERIQAHATNWAIERMAVVDRTILRMAAYELIHRPETPVSVVIDEALEIAKKYSSEDSSRFINGILDKLKQYRPAAPAP